MPGGAATGWELLVEREIERELIEGALAGCARGSGRVVLLYGPSGVGRSSLLRAAVLEASSRDIAVLEASGSELERGYGFGIVRQLLEARMARMTAARRRSIVGDVGPATESALGIGHAVTPGSSATFAQTEGVHRLVSALASERPLLVAVDDLQWCDRPSLDFLCFLGHRATRMPVCIVASWRRGEPGVRAGRLQALAGSPETVFLTPAPLTRDGVRAFLRIQGEEEADDEAIGAIHAQTGGQPFLVSELVAGLRLRGMHPEAGQREVIASVTPESVRRNIAARLGRQPEPVRRFAQAAAVLGQASLGQTAALAAIDPEKARGVADALVRSGIIRDDAVMVFTEPLLRSAVYGTLSSLECAALHQRAAALLLDASSSTDAADDARIVEHLLRSEPAGLSRFRDLLRSVAEERARAGAFADARRLLGRALTEVDDGARGETLARLAEVELAMGEPVAAVAHASEALALELDPHSRTTACLAVAHGLALSEGAQAAIAFLDNDVDHGGGDDVRATAAVVRACAGERPEASVTTAAAALSGATAAERIMLAVCAQDLLLTGAATAADVRGLCARALAENHPAECAAHYFAGASALHVDAPELVDALLARDADRSVAPDARIVRVALRSQLALARGDLGAADMAARDALAQIGAAAHSILARRVRNDMQAVLVLAAVESGHCETAAQALADLLAPGDAPSLTASTLRIAVALAQSRPADALAAVADVESAPAGVAAPGLAWWPWAALAFHAAGDRETAVAHAEAHLDHARSCGGRMLQGTALTIRGLVEPDDRRRVAQLEDAVAVLRDSAAVLALARAEIELGSVLRRLGRRRDARDCLVRGADLAHRCGAQALSARALAELVSVGARPRRAAFSGISALTASEHRVAILAASGLTNRAIAQELTVSAKTISGQLTAVYRKLDVHDRAALTAVMAEASDGRPGGPRPTRVAELAGTRVLDESDASATPSTARRHG